MAGSSQVAVGIMGGRDAGLADAGDCRVLVQAIAGVAGGGIGLGGAVPQLARNVIIGRTTRAALDGKISPIAKPLHCRRTSLAAQKKESP